MGAEDFAYYSHQIPACFFRLGAGNKAKGISSGVHTPTFNIDEGAIEIGMGMMAWLGGYPLNFVRSLNREPLRGNQGNSYILIIVF